MDKVRVGIIGTSGWSDMYFLPIFSLDERVNLSAICGRNQERTAEMSAKYNIPQEFNDYRRMIDEAQLDALVVASPDDLHFEMVMAALDAGLHVICEKPLANNAEHARQMLSKAESVGRIHMVNHTWRWIPHIQYMKHLMDERYLGKIFQGFFRFSFGSGYQRTNTWSNDANRSNGIVGNLGSHMIDMARWLLGDVSNVFASLASHVEPVSVDGRPVNPSNDSDFVLLEFRNGEQVCIQNSNVTHLADKSGISVSLYGEKGMLHTDYFLSNLNFILYAAQRDEGTLHPLDIPPEYLIGARTGDLFAHFMANPVGPRLFIEGILGNKQVEPNFQDGLLNQQVIDAALESQRTGRRIKIA